MKLEIQNISFAYENKQVLKNLNINVEKGEFVSILGPSGCGKSTLLKILSGVLSANAGQVLVDGKEASGVTEHFAYMPQDDLLFPWLTILDNVCLYGKIHKNYEAVKTEALKNFSTFGLKGYEKKYPSALSGGMRQRAAFLRTTLCHADILLLDEPFGALDVITRGEMQDWLLKMRRQLDRTVVLVTHDMDEAIYLSDRIIILNEGLEGIAGEIKISDKGRDRSWLYKQSALREKIYALIMQKQAHDE